MKKLYIYYISILSSTISKFKKRSDLSRGPRGLLLLVGITYSME